MPLSTVAFMGVLTASATVIHGVSTKYFGINQATGLGVLTEIYDISGDFFPGDGVNPASFTAPHNGTYYVGIHGVVYIPGLTWDTKIHTPAGIYTRTFKTSAGSVYIFEHAIDIALVGGQTVQFSAYKAGVPLAGEYLQGGPVNAPVTWVCGYEIV